MSRNTLPLDTGRKLNVHKRFKRCRRRTMNDLSAFTLRPVFSGLGLNSSFLFVVICG